MNISLFYFMQPEQATEPASNLVAFLQKFAEPMNRNPSVCAMLPMFVVLKKFLRHLCEYKRSCPGLNKALIFILPKVLKLELKEIREEQDLLFRFMNFLKHEGAVHVLQFCLTVGRFQ